MSDKPTVGRIVHFYDQLLVGVNSKHAYNDAGSQIVSLNGQNAGPYPAMVIQTFQGSEYVNLRVMAYGGEWTEGSVSENGKHDGSARYWEWPPRVGAPA